MLCTVWEAVPSFIWPWLVAAQAKARFGKVSVGTELNRWSQTAKPRARPDSTGSASGVNAPMMFAAVVPVATVRAAAEQLRIGVGVPLAGIGAGHEVGPGVSGIDLEHRDGLTAGVRIRLLSGQSLEGGSGRRQVT